MATFLRKYNPVYLSAELENRLKILSQQEIKINDHCNDWNLPPSPAPYIFQYMVKDGFIEIHIIGFIHPHSDEFDDYDESRTYSLPMFIYHKL